MDKIEKIRQESEELYARIDRCIDTLIKARLNKDTDCEGKSLFQMEGLMVGTQQFLCWILDTLSEEPNKSLEEAATKFAYSEGYQDPEYYNIVDAFKAGAKWMAQQGFSQEETVENKTLELGYDVLPGIDPIINLPNSFKPGDKVIVQVRKK